MRIEYMSDAERPSMNAERPSINHFVSSTLTTRCVYILSPAYDMTGYASLVH